jgi:hypothetical protein
LSVNGAWKPSGKVTGDPFTVAENALGAPAITVTGPVADTVCDWPAKSVPEKRTVPELSVAWTQHSPFVAESASV